MDATLIYAALCVSAFLAGAINSIAGGGTLLTFPALLAVVSPVVANGTSTLALVPGSLAGAWAYRQDVKHPPRLLWWLFAPSLVGGLIGTVLVTRTDEHYFNMAVPWLILAASALFSLQPLVARMTKNKSGSSSTEHTQGQLYLLACSQLFVGIYGGYFGAGIGILMLSALAYMGLRDVHEMNALKTILAVLMNGVAAVWFTMEGKVNWHYALPMALSSIAGGYIGARLSLRFKSSDVRRFVIAVGFTLSIYYFYKMYIK
jgi:uncharacterized membrane protein YfcA